MSRLTIPVVVISLALYSLVAVAQRGTPIPPSIRQGDKTQEQAAKDMPPPRELHPAEKPEKIKADARELAQLAQSIPSDVDSATGGVLPKDLSEKLKRIEKLAKQLRSELR